MYGILPWLGIVIYGLPLLLLGYIYKIRPPKKINPIYGYRTKQSMKNQEVWDYANKIGANAIINVGIITTISGVIPLITDWEHAHFIPLSIMVIALIGGMIYCEKLLNKRFDKEGNHL